MIKCNYCGIILQTDDKEKEGYTNKISNKICRRCFRIKNYNDYEISNLENDKIIPLLKTIDQKNSLIVLVIDVLSLVSNLEQLKKIFKRNILLVINKYDVLPKSIKENTILDNAYPFNSKVVVSSKTGYNMDVLFNRLRNETRNIYFVGYTNSGKSTLINRLIKNYSKDRKELTTSMVPSTTLGFLPVKINNELSIIDTPGLIDEGSITSYLNEEDLKKLENKARIKPRTYQMKKNDILDIDFNIYIKALEEVNLTVYFPNNVMVKKNNKKTLEDIPKVLVETDNSDVLISGLGFITIKKASGIEVYTTKNIDIIERASIFDK